MTPKQWIEFFGGLPPTSEIHKKVEHEVRAYLANVPPGMTATTGEIGEYLFPRVEGDKTLVGDTVRRKLYGVLSSLANSNLRDCCMKGDVIGKFMGRDKRPWLWFCPQCCPTCGQPVPMTEEGE